MAFVPCTPTFAAPAARRSAVSTRSPTMAAEKPAAAARLMGVAAAAAVLATSLIAPDASLALSNPLSGAGDAVSSAAADVRDSIKDAASSSNSDAKQVASSAGSDAKSAASDAAGAVGDKVKSDVQTTKEAAISKDREIKDNFDIDADKLAKQVCEPRVWTGGGRVARSCCDDMCLLCVPMLEAAVQSVAAAVRGVLFVLTKSLWLCDAISTCPCWWTTGGEGERRGPEEGGDGRGGGGQGHQEDLLQLSGLLAPGALGRERQ